MVPVAPLSIYFDGHFRARQSLRTEDRAPGISRGGLWASCIASGRDWRRPGRIDVVFWLPSCCSVGWPSASWCRDSIYPLVVIVGFTCMPVVHPQSTGRRLVNFRAPSPMTPCACCGGLEEMRRWGENFQALLNPFLLGSWNCCLYHPVGADVIVPRYRVQARGHRLTWVSAVAGNIFTYRSVTTLAVAHKSGAAMWSP